MIKKKSKFHEYAETIISAFIIAMVIRTFVIQAFKIPTGSMEPTLHGDPRHGDRIFVNKFIYRFKKPQRGDVVVFTTRDIPGLDKHKDYIKRLIGLPGETVEIKNGDIYINNKRITQSEISKNEYKNSSPMIGMLETPRKAIKIPEDFILSWTPSKGKFYLMSKSMCVLRDGIRPGGKFKFDFYHIKFMRSAVPLQVEFLAGGGHRVEFRKDGLYIDKKKYKDKYSVKGLYTLLGQYGINGHKIKIPGKHYFMLGDNSSNSKDSRYWGFVPEENVKGEAMFIWWPPKRWQIVR